MKVYLASSMLLRWHLDFRIAKLRSSLTSVDHVQEKEWTLLLSVVAMQCFASLRSRVVPIVCK